MPQPIALTHSRPAAEKIAAFIRKRAGGVKIAPGSSKDGGRLLDNDNSQENAIKKQLIKATSSFSSLAQSSPNSAADIILIQGEHNPERIRMHIELIAKEHGDSDARVYARNALLSTLQELEVIERKELTDTSTYYSINEVMWKKKLGDKIIMPEAQGAFPPHITDNLLENAIIDLLPQTPIEVIFQENEEAVNARIEEMREKFGEYFAEYYAAESLLNAMLKQGLIQPLVDVAGEITDYELTEDARQYIEKYFELDSLKAEKAMHQEVLRSAYAALVRFGSPTEKYALIEAKKEELKLFPSSDAAFLSKFNEWLKLAEFPPSIKAVLVEDEKIIIEGIHTSELIKFEKEVEKADIELDKNTFAIEDFLDIAAKYSADKINTKKIMPHEVVKDFETNAQLIIEREIRDFKQICEESSAILRNIVKKYDSSNTIEKEKKDALQQVIDTIDSQKNQPFAGKKITEQADMLFDARKKINLVIDTAKAKPIISEHHGVLGAIKAGFKTVAYGIVNFFRGLAGKEAITWQTTREKALNNVHSNFVKPGA